jgi:predicted regulator of Ras-like GTPase activity (Roadblock/LC7/MglB family)
MDVETALAELTDLSPQIEAAVVVDGDGAVLGSTPAGGRGDVLARAAREALAAADSVRDGGSRVTRVEVTVPRGGLVVVRDGERSIAATTVPGATVELVVFDLRTCLGRVAAGTGGVRA